MDFAQSTEMPGYAHEPPGGGERPLTEPQGRAAAVGSKLVPTRSSFATVAAWAGLTRTA
jgi:hypothetical protein